MHERLGQVPSQLPFGYVVFLGVQAGGTARGPGALEPADGADLVALLVQGQGQDEPAEQEGALGITQRPRVVPEPVGVAVLGEFVR